jgi:hypothetical protein
VCFSLLLIIHFIILSDGHGGTSPIYHHIYITASPHHRITASPPANKPLEPHLTAFDTIQFRSHIEIEIQLLTGPRALGIRLPLVEINDILDRLATAALDDPIMPIKRLGVARETLDSRLGAQRAAPQALERQQFGPAARRARTPFPPFNQRPCPLVHCVVDRDDR